MRNGNATPATSIGFLFGPMVNRELSTDTADKALNNSMHTNTVSERVCGDLRPEPWKRASHDDPSVGDQEVPHLLHEES